MLSSGDRQVLLKKELIYIISDQHFYGAHDDRAVRYQTAEAAFQIPELLEADVRPEAALRNMVILELQSHAVRNDRRLPDGYIGKGSGMDKNGLTFHTVCLASIRLGLSSRPACIL